MAGLGFNNVGFVGSLRPAGAPPGAPPGAAMAPGFALRAQGVIAPTDYPVASLSAASICTIYGVVSSDQTDNTALKMLLTLPDGAGTKADLIFGPVNHANPAAGFSLNTYTTGFRGAGINHPATVSNRLFLFTARLHNNNAAAFSLRLDGQAVALADYQGTQANRVFGTRVFIGSDDAGGLNWAGLIRDIVVYTTATDAATDANNEAFLKNLYGLTF